MKRCAEYEPLIESLLAEEIADADRDRLLAHSQDCAECRQFVDLHFQLRDPDLAEELPTAGQFAAMRQSVLAGIRAEGSGRSAPRGLFEALRAFLLRPALAGGIAALMLVMLGSGYLLGRPASPWWSGSDTVPLDSLIADIGREAAGNRRLADVEDSPFVFTNVAFEDARDDRLALRFDVTRHVEVSRAKDDPLVKEILAQSLVNPTPLGTRLEAIRYADKVVDPKIEEALIFSMLNDSTLAVRIKAQNLLASYEPDAQIQAAFMMVLSGEESVQMRLRAMDYLAASGATPASLDEVLDNLQRDADSALLMRAVEFGR